MAMRATADRKKGVIPWEKITTEKTMTIYGAYDADKTIKFEFKAESGHDVYQVADLTAFNACDLTDATKMDEVCFHHVMCFFFVSLPAYHTHKEGCPSQKCVWRVYSTALFAALTFFHDRSLL